MQITFNKMCNGLLDIVAKIDLVVVVKHLLQKEIANVNLGPALGVRCSEATSAAVRLPVQNLAARRRYEEYMINPIS